MNVAALPLPHRLRRSQSWVAGIIFVAALLVLVFLTAYAAPHEPRAISDRPLMPPSRAHLLGTNELGQDLFSGWLHGARISLGIGFTTAALSTMLAVAAGTASVLWPQGRLVVLALIDAFLAIPQLPLLVLIVAFLGPGRLHLVGGMVLVGWPAYARIVRVQVRAATQRAYVEAARALGASPGRIFRTCVLPEIAPILWTKFLLTVRWAILMEAALALLGLGDPAQVSWGTILHGAFGYPLLFIGSAWLWWAVPTALSIAGLTLALALIGRDFETWLNPTGCGLERLRHRCDGAMRRGVERNQRVQARQQQDPPDH